MEVAWAIVSLARSLGYEVVAEGIELESQLAILVEMGCHLGQGYLVSPPVPADRLPALAAFALGENAARRRSRGRLRRAIRAPIRRSCVLPHPFRSGGGIPATTMPEPSAGRARHATRTGCRRRGCTVPASGRRDQRTGSVRLEPSGDPS